MMTDMHSHVLPAIDDGSGSVAESIELLKLEARQGITHVVATPHFYARHDRPEAFFQRRNEALMRLREEMKKYPELPSLSVGAEVRYFPGMSQSEVISDLTIDGNRCILVELKEEPWGESVFRELERLYYDRGLTPVIAHVERYILPFRLNDHIRKLEELPVLLQCNAGFFLDMRTRRRALRMLKKHKIHVLGSDCHDLTHRPPKLGEAEKVIRRELGVDALRWIRSNERKILNP